MRSRQPASFAPRRVVSMRLIVTAAAVVLISAAVLGVGSIAERNVRATLLQEIETRLALEARNLALISTSALLTDFPELTLHPLVRTMAAERPGLEFVYVVDRHGIVQGHADAVQLGTAFQLDKTLVVRQSQTTLSENETLLANQDLLVVKVPILHHTGETLGQAIVGLKRSHVDAALRSARKGQVIVLVSILAASVLLTMVLMSVLLRPISTIRAGLERIGHGDLDTRVALGANTELTLVARSINDMTQRLKAAQEELLEKERLSHEMELAHRLQRSLLPTGPTVAGDYVVAGSQSAAAEVGGDYYDIFPLGKDQTGIVIADVAGKGLAGCLVTSMLAVLIRTLRTSYASPSELMVALQDVIMDSLQPGTFITMFYGILDKSTGQLTFASAAHNPVLHYRAATAQASWYHTKGIPLGLVDRNILRQSLTDHAIFLEPGDLVLETTDGFNEAADPTMAEFGFDRIRDHVVTNAPKGCAAVMESLQHAVTKWEASLPANDDKTLIAISRAPRAEAGAPRTGDGRRSRAGALWNRREGSDHLSITASLSAVDAVGPWLRQCESLRDWNTEGIALIEQGLYEVLCNIAEHGCALDESKTIDIWWIVDRQSSHADRGAFLVRDRGRPPVPESWAPRDGLRERRRKGRGYGLELIDKTISVPEFCPETPVGNLTVVRIGPGET